MSILAASVLAGGSLLGSLFGGSSARKAAAASTAAQLQSTQLLTQQADRAAQLQYDLGQGQLDFARRQYEESIPLRDQIVGLQMDAQRQQMSQAGDYYDYMRGVYRPVETRMAAQATQFDTEAYRERMAAEASQRAAMAFEGSQGALRRDLTRRGINPNSGAFAAMGNQNAIAMAGLQATGANAARAQAEQMGWARNLDVAGLGRNLPGASSAAYQGATGAGTSAMNVQGAPMGLYNQGYQLGAGTIGTGMGQALTGYGNLLGDTSRSAMNASNTYFGSIGALTGMAGTGAAYLYGLG
jgi:hypothetical protein